MDLSEIQLNFELEESEMRIFSEDETLLSTFDSASVMSQGSPYTNPNLLPRDRHGRNSVGVNFCINYWYHLEILWFVNTVN